MRIAFLALSFVCAVTIGCGIDPLPPESAQDDVVAEPNASTAEDSVVIDPGGGQCGTKVCGKGTFCCNASCSVCAPIGGGCTQQVCEARD